MCDYSLEMYRSRPAQAGETYETRRFPSGSIGFVAASDPTTAICLSCDTRLKLEDIPERVRKAHNLHTAELATFVQRDEGPYRDAICFDNSTVLTLQFLGEGVRARIVDALIEPAKVPAAREDALV